MGYILGFAKAHQIAFSAIPKYSIKFSWLHRLGELTPNPKFLSDVAAFEAVIIAFLVPLSIEIISKISERYTSNVITRSFESHWGNKILPPFLLINIVAAIILRFLFQDGTNSLTWKIVAWIVLFFLLFIAFVVWRVITRIKIFMSDTTYVINQLYLDVEKSLE